MFHEAYAVSMSELKQAVEVNDLSGVKKLSQPERSERLNAQRTRLAGVDIIGLSEPSDLLIDACAAMYETNTLQYIPWESCTCQEAELMSSAKKGHVFRRLSCLMQLGS